MHLATNQVPPTSATPHPPPHPQWKPLVGKLEHGRTRELSQTLPGNWIYSCSPLVAGVEPGSKRSGRGTREQAGGAWNPGASGHGSPETPKGSGGGSWLYWQRPEALGKLHVLRLRNPSCPFYTRQNAGELNKASGLNPTLCHTHEVIVQHPGSLRLRGPGSLCRAPFGWHGKRPHRDTAVSETEGLSVFTAVAPQMRK